MQRTKNVDLGRDKDEEKSKKPNNQENKDEEVTTNTHRQKIPPIVLWEKPKWMEVTRLLQEKKVTITKTTNREDGIPDTLQHGRRLQRKQQNTATE